MLLKSTSKLTSIQSAYNTRHNSSRDLRLISLTRVSCVPQFSTEIRMYFCLPYRFQSEHYESNGVNENSRTRIGKIKFRTLASRSFCYFLLNVFGKRRSYLIVLNLSPSNIESCSWQTIIKRLLTIITFDLESSTCKSSLPQIQWFSWTLMSWFFLKFHKIVRFRWKESISIKLISFTSNQNFWFEI